MSILDFFKKRSKLGNKLKIICFDLDNTLYDYGTAESEAEVYIAEEIHKTNNKLLPSEFLKVFNVVKRSHMHKDLEPKKYSRELWFKETFKKLKIKKDPKVFESKYWEYLTSRIKFFPNTLVVLETLQKKYVLACLSDSDGEKSIKLNRLKKLGLDKYFTYIIVTDDTGLNKPAIENWEYLIKISQTNGNECMMIGDHPDVDLINSKKLGFVTVSLMAGVISEIFL